LSSLLGPCLQLRDRRSAVEGIESSVPTAVRLREMPPAPASELEQRVVPLADDEDASVLRDCRIDRDANAFHEFAILAFGLAPAFVYPRIGQLRPLSVCGQHSLDRRQECLTRELPAVPRHDVCSSIRCKSLPQRLI